MTDLLLHRAGEVAPAIDPEKTTLLIVAHGTDLNENSAVAAKREVEKIRATGRYAEALNVYMEEPPLVSDWVSLTTTPNVIVVPFFIADGLHSYEDIPQLLGIVKPDGAASRRGDSGAVFERNPHRVHGRSLFYAPSIGTDPRMVEIIIAQTKTGNGGI
jgi:sirohydrochlorin cobaltochelatase